MTIQRGATDMIGIAYVAGVATFFYGLLKWRYAGGATLRARDYLYALGLAATWPAWLSVLVFFVLFD